MSIRQSCDVNQETLETTGNFRDIQTYNACGTMEKVWDELKKNEAQAEQIQNDAQDREVRLKNNFIDGGLKAWKML